MNFYNFNDANDSNEFELIPAGTLAKVQLKIKPGGFTDETLQLGLQDKYPTMNESSGAIYLNCEYTVLEGKYARRKIWSMIGLYSEKNNNRWGDMGRSFIRRMLSSAHGYSLSDESPEALRARQIDNFAELDGLEFVARIDVERASDGSDKNIIKTAIGPEHNRYNELMQQVVRTEWA